MSRRASTADREAAIRRQASLVEAARAQVAAVRPRGAPRAGSPVVPEAPARSPESLLGTDVALPAPLPSFSPPISLPGYDVIRELRRGGQGVIYLAIQRSTKRTVAIKVLREGPFAGPGDRVRFEREVEILAQLNHPNIVAIHDSGEASWGAGQHSFFVMDYLEGRSLQEFVSEERGRLLAGRPWRGAGKAGRGAEVAFIRSTVVLFAKICDAVNAAHLRGIIHRDLKPSNILVDARGEPRVLDFGLAKVSSAPAPAGVEGVTLSGQFIGSLPWASPEQAGAAGGEGAIDTRTDVYSLGVTLYSLLTGRFPYSVEGSPRDVLDNILRAEPVRPSAVWGRIGPELDTILLKCLAKDRERRYQTAGELARDLRHYLAREPIEARRESLGYLLRKAVWRNRLGVGAAVVVLVFAGAVVWGVGQRRAAEGANRAAVRQGWVATLQNARMERESMRDPRSEVRAAMLGLWNLIRTGEATGTERRELAISVVNARLIGRQFLSLAHVNRGPEGAIRLPYEVEVGWIPSGFGVVIRPSIQLDQEPLESMPEPTAFRRYATREVTFEVPRVSREWHGLTGRLMAQLMVFPQGSETSDTVSAASVNDLSEFAASPPVAVPMTPLAFAAMQDFPPAYPFVVTEQELDSQTRFSDSIRLQRACFVFASSLAGIVPAARDVLRVTLDFSRPPLEVAISVRITVPGTELEDEQIFALGFDNRTSEPRLLLAPIDRAVAREGDLWRIEFDVPALRIAATSNPEELIGRRLIVEISPSREAAIQAPLLERYLAVSATRETTVTNARDAVHRQAAAIAYSLVHELAVPDDRALERLDRLDGLSEAIVQAAEKILRQAGTSTVLCNQAARVVYGTSAGTDSRRRALLRAQAAVRQEPGNAAIALILGFALYRNDRFAEALTVPTSNPAVESADIGTRLAFVAMAEVQLGHADRARATLDQLRQWLKSNPGPPARVPLLLAEAEALIRHTRTR